MEWPGRYIPIVRCPGEETRIGRKMKRRGIIRFAKDAQRAYNYGRSTQTEITALQPKAPFIGTEKNFEQYQDFWSIGEPQGVPVSALHARPEQRRHAAAARRCRRCRRRA